MKASALATQLIKLIGLYGDLEVTDENGTLVDEAGHDRIENHNVIVLVFGNEIGEED